MIEIKKATKKDAVALARASEQAFHSDIDCGAPGLGGPPGYNSPAWQQRAMGFGDYFKILVDGQLAGGLIVIRQKPREYEVGRIFVDPEYQNQGVGTRAFDLLWEAYPLAKRWIVGTPDWNTRTRHFYQKVGFEPVPNPPPGEILFQRTVKAGAQS